MTPQDDKVRVNARISKELYDNICQEYDSMTMAINEALELLIESKQEPPHNEYDNIRQPNIQELRARIEDLKAQVDLLTGQLTIKDNQIAVKDNQIANKDSQIEKQAFSLQSVIQENSRLNVKLLPENTEKKKWFEFWKIR